MKPHIRKLLSLSLTSVEPNTATTPSPPPGPPWPLVEAPSSGPYKSSIVLAVLAVLTISVFFLGFLSICIQRFSDNPAAEFSRRRGRRSPYRTSSFPTSELRSWSYRRSGLDPAKLQALPVYPHGGINEKYYETMDCAICLGEFQGEETVKVIPFCKHVFHPHCIDTWLYSHVTCPVCRATRLFDEENGGRSTVGSMTRV
ncbi:RING-H2 finger protein ATL57-like [Juglans regia]|uniref:RING-type E3 ubiquitin transferase n=1 Tax=Juglans regia TaxID=51240 RepID=A0A2I4FNA7_JUGRE|nr:RING-H2 finger protein ATL57-like [Juglans regia]